MPTQGYGYAISTHYTVREYIEAGIAGAHIEDQTFPPKSGPRRRCISIQEMVGKLRAAMDAKQALDPDFAIMARCDLGGVPGASFAEIIERCQAYKAEAQVDVICPNGLRTWEEIQEAIRRHCHGNGYGKRLGPKRVGLRTTLRRFR